MIKIKDNNGRLLLRVDAEMLEGANLWGANLPNANLIGADFTGADLASANLEGANLEGANLWGAILKDAYLEGAYLEGANLTNANLIGADFTGADLASANLEGANLEDADFTGAHGIIEGPKRSDGYTFYLVKHETPMVKAGCQWMSISDYRKRVAAPGYRLAEETAAILDHLETEAIKRGWIATP